MIAQQYRIIVGDNISDMEPGHLVFRDFEDDNITGFISQVMDDRVVEITLFEPQDISDIENIVWTKDTANWLEILQRIITDNPEMHDVWMSVIFSDDENGEDLAEMVEAAMGFTDEGFDNIDSHQLHLGNITRH